MVSSFRTRCQQISLLGALWLSVTGVAAAEADSAGIRPLDCVINPSVVADLGSGVPGVLTDVRVDRSDLVEAGDLLAELDSGVELASLELANARANMDTEVQLRRVNAAFGRRLHARSEDLFKRQAISTNDMDERETEARQARILLRQAQDEKKLAELELRRAEEVLKRRTIQSPISGVVMERFKSVGEYIDDQPVVRVAQLDPLHVEVFVPVEHLGEVQTGMRARVWSDAVASDAWQAQVSRVDRVADVASATYGVRLTLPNPKYKIPAGLRCMVQFVGQDESPATAEASPPSASGEEVAVREKATHRSGSVTQPLRDSADRVAMHDKTAEGKVRLAKSGVEGHKAAPAVAPFEVAQLGEQQVAAADAVPTGQQTIGPADSAPAALPAATAVGLAAQLPLCLSAGPFEQQADADRKARALRSVGLEVAVDQRDDEVDVGHKVVSEWLPNREAAVAHVERRVAAGVRDLYLPKRRRAVRVALGLYKRKNVAIKRVKELADLGFKAEIVPWRERKQEFILAVRGVPSDKARELLADLPVPATEDAVRGGGCDELASR